MNFRPCIDLHDGLVKQIVGSTLNDQKPTSVQTNFVAEKPPEHYAALYKKDNLPGGHIIKLGPGNDQAAEDGLAAWPGGMQVGGGITAENASDWLEKGASHVIVTSWVFCDGRINMKRLNKLVSEVGKDHLVLDLSCRRKGDSYMIVTDRWQKFTDVIISKQVLDELSNYCDEFLIHAADVEGKCSGVEEKLVTYLGQWSTIPTTYAGGVRGIDDLELVFSKGDNKLDITVGSALDIFGGTSMSYKEAVSFCRKTLDKTV